MLNFH